MIFARGGAIVSSVRRHELTQTCSPAVASRYVSNGIGDDRERVGHVVQAHADVFGGLVDEADGCKCCSSKRLRAQRSTVISTSSSTVCGSSIIKIFADGMQPLEVLAQQQQL